MLLFSKKRNNNLKNRDVTRQRPLQACVVEGPVQHRAPPDQHRDGRNGGLSTGRTAKDPKLRMFVSGKGDLAPQRGKEGNNKKKKNPPGSAVQFSPFLQKNIFIYTILSFFWGGGEGGGGHPICISTRQIGSISPNFLG